MNYYGKIIKENCACGKTKEMFYLFFRDYQIKVAEFCGSCGIEEKIKFSSKKVLFRQFIPLDDLPMLEKCG